MNSHQSVLINNFWAYMGKVSKFVRGSFEIVVRSTIFYVDAKLGFSGKLG